MSYEPRLGERKGRCNWVSCVWNRNVFEIIWISLSISPLRNSFGLSLQLKLDNNAHTGVATECHKTLSETIPHDTMGRKCGEKEENGCPTKQNKLSYLCLKETMSDIWRICFVRRQLLILLRTWGQFQWYLHLCSRMCRRQNGNLLQESSTFHPYFVAETTKAGETLIIPIAKSPRELWSKEKWCALFQICNY